MWTSITISIKLEKFQQNIPNPIPSLAFDYGFLKNRRVLLASDDKFSRLVPTAILESFGAIVTVSENSGEAIELMLRQPFDIMLVDLQMAGEDGFETIKAIRENGYTNPIVGLTVEGINGKNINGGMDDYVAKPVKEQTLLPTLRKWIENEDNSINNVSTISNDTPLYDLSSLKSISRGNEAFVSKMVKIFCQQTPLMLVQVEDALKAGDIDQAKAVMHKMKPSMQDMRVVSVTKLIKDIEALEYFKFNFTDMAVYLQSLKCIIAQVITQLQKEYPIE